MDSATSILAKIVVRAVDDAGPALKAVAGGLDQVEAAATRTDAALAKAAEGVRATEAQAATAARGLAAAETEVAGAATKAGTAVSAAGGSAEKQASIFEKAKTSIGATAHTMMMIGAAAVAIVAGTAYMASKFSSDMEMIRTQAGASQAEVTKMSAAVLAMSTSVGQGPDALAAGLYHIESAGYRGATALKILRAAAEGAAVGHANLEDVTQSLISVTASHIKGITSETQAMGILNGIVGAGDMRMQQLADAMSTGIASSAAVFGLSIKDVGAALATMGDNLMQGAMAGTRLRMTIALMGAPSKAAAASLATIGLGSTTLADDMRKPNGLLVALQDLKTHLVDSGMTASQQAQVIAHAFGGGRSGAVLMLLLTQLDRLKSKYADIGAGAKKFGEDWAATQQTVTFQMHQVQAGAETLGVVMGQAFLPPLHAILGALTPVLAGFAQFAAGHSAIVAAALAIGIAIGAVGVALKLGLGLWKTYKEAQEAYLAIKGAVTAALFGTQAATDAETGALVAQDGVVVASTGLWVAFTAVLDANPISLIILAIAALVAGLILLITHLGPVKDAFMALWSALSEKLLGVFNMVHDAIMQVGQVLMALGSKIGQIAGTIGSFISSKLQPLAGAFDKVKSAASGVASFLGGVFDATLGHVGQSISDFAHEHDKARAAATSTGHAINMVNVAAERQQLDLKKVSTDLKQATADTQKYAKELTALSAQLNGAYNEALAKATLDILHHGAATEADVAALIKARNALDRYNAAQTEAAKIGTMTGNVLIPEAAKVATAWVDAAKKTAAAWKNTFDGLRNGAVAAAKATNQAANAQGAGPKASLGPLGSYADTSGAANQIGKEIAAALLQASRNTAGSTIQQQTGASGIASGMYAKYDQLTAAIGKLPASLQGAMAAVTARFRTEMDQASENYNRSVRTEDDRHVKALQAIEKAHEQTIKAVYAADKQKLASLNQSHEQAVQTHIQSYNQAASQQTQAYKTNMATANQAEKSLLAQHEGNLKSLHAAYIAKLAGENAKQQAATTASYQKAVASEDKGYSRQEKAIQTHIAGLTKAYQQHDATAAAREKKWLADNDAAYAKRAAGIQKSTQDGINKANQAEKTKISAENQAYATHLTALKAAFAHHAQLIENAMKEGAKPQNLWTALSAGVQKQGTNTTNALDMAELEGAKNIGQYVQAVVQAQAEQKKLTDAQAKGASAVARATGDWVTVLKTKAQNISDAIDQATAAIEHDILVRGSATVADIAQLVKAEKAQKVFTDAQNRAALIVARATGDWAAVLAAKAQKIADAVDKATARVTLDILNRGKASATDIASLVKAEKAQTAYNNAQNKAALIVARATGQWATVLQATSTKVQTALDNATAKVVLDILKHGQASTADVASLVKAQEAQDTYTAAQQQAAMIVAQATGQWKDALSAVTQQISDGLSNATGLLTLDFLNNGKASQADIDSAKQAQAAQDKVTQASWDASYAMADAGTQASMLAQRFQHIVSEQSNAQSIKDSVSSAQQAVIDQAAATVVDAIDAQTKQIEDQTSVIQAEAAYTQAAMSAQLAAIQDQAGIIQAQGQVAVAQLAYQQDAATAAQATDAQSRAQAQAQLRDDQLKIQIAQDGLVIARATAQLNQIQAHWQMVQAADQVRIASDQAAADAATAAATAQIDTLKLKVAADNLAVAQAQAKIQTDQLSVQTDIASALTGVNDYGAMIAADTAALTSTQQQALADNQALSAAQNQANAIAAQWQQTVALDNQQLAEDQAAGQQATLDQQMTIAQDQNKLASDTAAEQLAAQQATTQAVNNLASNSQANDEAMIAALEQLVTDSKSAVAAHRGTPAAKTTSGFWNGIAGEVAGTVSAPA